MQLYQLLMISKLLSKELVYKINNKSLLAGIFLNLLSFLQHQQRLALYSYVTIENHFHLIASTANLSKKIGYFKSFVANYMQQPGLLQVKLIDLCGEAPPPSARY